MNNHLIIIISEYFGPVQNVGAVKFTKIAKYLSRNPENEIVVFSRQSNGIIDPFLKNDVKEIKDNGGRVLYIFAGSEYLTDKRIFIRRALEYVKYLLQRYIRIMDNGGAYYRSNQREAKLFENNAIKKYMTEVDREPYAVISTYDDWGGHCLGMKLKEMYPQCVWIADFRDPIGSFIKDGKYRELCDQYSVEISEKADYVSVTSYGMSSCVKLSKNVKPVILTNGFDREDFEFLKQDIHNKDTHENEGRKLRFAYTGAFYSLETLVPLYNVINDLLSEEMVSRECIEILYAGEYSDQFYSEVKNAGLDDLYINLGVLPRSDAIRLVDSADVFLVAAWNTSEYIGVLTGKFLTNLPLQKYIICIVSGDTADSEIKERMNRLNCGFCYEEAADKTDYEELKEEVSKLYQMKMAGKKIRKEYNLNELQEYDLRVISMHYENLISTQKEI